MVVVEGVASQLVHVPEENFHPPSTLNVPLSKDAGKNTPASR
jgi:hypothetical protein